MEFSVVPLGVGLSLSRYIAEVLKVLKKRGLKHEIHAMGTVVEGEWDEIFSVIRECHETLNKMGVERILTTVKIDDRRDKKTTIEGKVEAVQRRIT